MIKTHNVTGLKYFCKSTKEGEKLDRYKGSGVYWLRHIKKHGYDVTTEIYKEFQDDNLLLTQCALSFSEEHNIVESKEWANLIVENGLDGNVKGNKHSKSAIANMKNTVISDEHKKLISTHQSEKMECTKCGKVTNRFNHNKYHGSKCGLDHSFRVIYCTRCKLGVGINNIKQHTNSCFDNISIASLETRKCKVCGVHKSVYGVIQHENVCKSKTLVEMMKIKKRSSCLKCKLEVSNGNLSRHLIKCLS